jgi:hypothetical protein
MELASCNLYGVASTCFGKFVNSTSTPCGMVFTGVLKERVLEVAHFSKMWAGVSEMAWRHIPEARTIDSYSAGNLNSSMQVSIAQREWHV